MYNFDKLRQVLSMQKEQKVSLKRDNIANTAYLCLADTTEEALRYGLNSVSVEEIETLIESTWGLITMEEDCEEESVDNYYTPFGEKILNEEITHLLLKAKNKQSGEKIF